MTDPRSSDMPPGEALARQWLLAAATPEIARGLESVYSNIAAQVTSRGPACWASGRCCNFERTGHRLYTTGLEAAYTVARLGSTRRFTPSDVAAALTIGGCPFQDGNLCSVHPIRPLGCRVYFCDRTAQDWQKDLTEHGLSLIRSLHDRHVIPYRYAEWRSLLMLLASDACD